MKNQEKINKDLIEFWNSAITLSSVYKEELQKEIPDYKDLAPSLKLFNVAKELLKFS